MRKGIKKLKDTIKDILEIVKSKRNRRFYLGVLKEDRLPNNEKFYEGQLYFRDGTEKYIYALFDKDRNIVILDGGEIRSRYLEKVVPDLMEEKYR